MSTNKIAIKVPINPPIKPATIAIAIKGSI
jgi:hypothetical protein